MFTAAVDFGYQDDEPRAPCALAELTMMRNTLSILQKTYDEAYMRASTAVYYESQVRQLGNMFAGYPLLQLTLCLYLTGQRGRGYEVLEDSSGTDLRPQCQQDAEGPCRSYRNRESAH